MEKILITGSNGFLGSRIIDFLKTQYDIYENSKLDITNGIETINYIKTGLRILRLKDMEYILILQKMQF